MSAHVHTGMQRPPHPPAHLYTHPPGPGAWLPRMGASPQGLRPYGDSEQTPQNQGQSPKCPAQDAGSVAFWGEVPTERANQGGGDNLLYPPGREDPQGQAARPWGQGVRQQSRWMVTAERVAAPGKDRDTKRWRSLEGGRSCWAGKRGRPQRWGARGPRSRPASALGAGEVTADRADPGLLIDSPAWPGGGAGGSDSGYRALPAWQNPPRTPIPLTRGSMPRTS